MSSRSPVTWSAKIANADQVSFGVPQLAYLTNPDPLGDLPPFALCAAFPRALVGRDAHDYYGGSVTLGLAPLRPSRVSSPRNVLERRRLPVRPLECIHYASAFDQSVAWKKPDSVLVEGVGL
jgi:hypothetical protein